MLVFLLQGQAPLVVGAVLLIALMGFRAAATDPSFRSDLKGALVFLVGFLALRTAAIPLHGHLPASAEKALAVSWMLLFAFGVIRAAVSTALWSLRLSSRATPKILRDVIDFSLYALATVPILKAELDIDLTGLLATSAILSVVIGLALQDTLGNLFAGLSIQLERPFQVGDIVTIAEHTGRVVQLAWRATRLETGRGEIITLPNNILSKQPVKNYSRGQVPIGIDAHINGSYEAPPNRVKEVILESLREATLVLAAPPPRCWTAAYDDSGIRYALRFFVADFVHGERVLDEFYSLLWYRFRREGIEVSFPHRTIHLVSAGKAPADLSAQAVEHLLDSVDLFSGLSKADRALLASQVTQKRFGKGERIIERGSPGHAFFVVASGEVSVRTGNSEVEVIRLSQGQYFGEMSLLTGEPRLAAVVAATDVVLLEVTRPVFSRLFNQYPGLARQLSSLLAQRRNQLKVAPEPPGENAAGSDDGRILGRLRHLFGLAPE